MKRKTVYREGYKDQKRLRLTPHQSNPFEDYCPLRLLNRSVYSRIYTIL